MPHRGIFLKDKESYKEDEAERDMLKQYITDYLGIEIKNMSEKELESMMDKARKMIEEDE